MNIRPRTDWQDPSMPVVGPGILLGEIVMVPAHYTAAADVPDGDIPAYLRSIQHDYTVNRGYSIGYSFAVDKTGTAWECRGFDIKCAANQGMNDITIAVLCLVDGANAMNPAMVDTFTGLADEAQHRCGRLLEVVGHRDIGSTVCPGDGIYHQVVAGDLDPAAAPEPLPPPIPDLEEYDMAFIIINRDTGQPTLVYGDGRVTGIDGGSFAAFDAMYGPAITVEAVTFDDFASKED